MILLKTREQLSETMEGTGQTLCLQSKMPGLCAFEPVGGEWGVSRPCGTGGAVSNAQGPAEVL